MMPAPTITTSALSRMTGLYPNPVRRVSSLPAAAAGPASARRDRDAGRTHDGLSPDGDPPPRSGAYLLRAHRDRQPARGPIDPPHDVRSALPAGDPARPRVPAPGRAAGRPH